MAVRLSDSPEAVQTGAGPVSGATAAAAGCCPSSDLDETEDEAKRAEQLARPSGQKQPKGNLLVFDDAKPPFPALIVFPFVGIISMGAFYPSNLKLVIVHFF